MLNINYAVIDNMAHSATVILLLFVITAPTKKGIAIRPPPHERPIAFTRLGGAESERHVDVSSHQL